MTAGRPGAALLCPIWRPGCGKLARPGLFHACAAAKPGHCSDWHKQRQI